MAFSRLWRVFVTHSRASPVDASPVLRVRGGDITTIIACASASCTRDRLAESNQSTRAKHYEHDPYLFARPVRSPSARHAQAPFARAHHRMPAPVIDRSASLEVCGPCNAHWLRSRCPGRPVSGRSRFGVSSSRRPARILSCTCRPRCFTFALAVFRFQRIHSDEARLADAYRVGALESNPSLARRVTPMGPDASVSAGRRPVALATCVFDRTRR
jgi:hypothetical protein